ncbi:hypothetical protein F2Q69_00031180 [Brassica cretica]|uniref:Uncharacterized protein n=1 Tax=Brassica cretica TaxID=69181 RepID=A0A8S9SAG1_BRACR|nr:hypothetical protein F2Q69_00031180 [Brassica cretica]
MFLSLHQNTLRLASLSLLSTTRCLSSSPLRLRRFFLISHASIGVSLGGLFSSLSVALLDGEKPQSLSLDGSPRHREAETSLSEVHLDEIKKSIVDARSNGKGSRDIKVHLKRGFGYCNTDVGIKRHQGSSKKTIWLLQYRPRSNFVDLLHSQQDTVFGFVLDSVEQFHSSTAHTTETTAGEDEQVLIRPPGVKVSKGHGKKTLASDGKALKEDSMSINIFVLSCSLLSCVVMRSNKSGKITD